MVKMKFVVGYVSAAQLAHLPVTADHFEHNVSGNVATPYPSALPGFSCTFGDEKNWANMAKHVAFDLGCIVALKLFPILGNVVEEALDHTRHFLSGFEIAPAESLENLVEARSDVGGCAVARAQRELLNENAVRAILELPAWLTDDLRVFGLALWHTDTS